MTRPARLLSVNVGMPRDIEWRGMTVRTGIWKASVPGRCFVRRLNLDGDGQGDLAGHGGEQRAVFVYQADSYRYWQAQLGRDDLVHGQFGENLTIEGLPDDDVCIGDRYRIGTALFEVTQPRTTCYRVGIRLSEPRMAALLTSSGRPGFYCRVLEEGAIGAGDDIVLVAKGPERMTVTVVNGLLYTKDHPHDLLVRALRIPALSPGWRASFEALVERRADHPGSTGAAGLGPVATGPAARPGLRPLNVVSKQSECADVVSFVLQPTDATPLTLPGPGQFVVVRLAPQAGGTLYRSYSLSGPPSDREYRISVRLEPRGVAGAWLGGGLRPGQTLDVSDPRGAFVLQEAEGPVVLVSAGIGATPVLAMLHALSAARSAREVWWLHGARDGHLHAFAAETRGLLDALVRARSHIWYSAPSADDRSGRDFDSTGRMDAKAFDRLGVPVDGDFYLCGPPAFLAGLYTGLSGRGVATDRIHSENFGGGPALMPGVVGHSSKAPHPPDGVPGTGPLVSFARSGIATRWRTDSSSLLELAEACDVPVRWSCRSGVCHNCESALVAGSVDYAPEPLQPPAQGNVLICCARPTGDIVLDL